MKMKKALGVIICTVLAVTVIASQVIVGLAEPECTCGIIVHGSNCPLSQCTCSAQEEYMHAHDGAVVVHHEEGCALYGVSEDLTQCVCQADIHAPGCPRYAGSEEYLNVQEDQDGENSDEAYVPDEQSQDEVEIEAAPIESEEANMKSNDNEQFDDSSFAVISYFYMENLLRDHINEIRELLRDTEISVRDESKNFSDILAVYAVMYGQTENYPYDIQIDADDFASIYWSMTQVTGVSNTKGAVINVNRLSVADAAELYDLSDDQAAVLASLTGYEPVITEALYYRSFGALTEEEIEFTYLSAKNQ